MEKVINPDRIAATIHHRLSEGWFVLLPRHFYFAIFFQLVGSTRGWMEGRLAGHDDSSESHYLGAACRFCSLRVRWPALYYFCSRIISTVFISRDVVGQLIDDMALERLFADNAPRKKANGGRNIFFVKNGLM
ncbi:hypothetical protein CEXT_244981 [Caerostris extrusa]|uniref:Uncharacterized protein n=1 Tax=Caerostris extrusa TaxID=172846 RepID=A0AAV4V3Q8_CAEEX|nr:hypothetical protein CEXT_244981 [Caerostris extrusa]